MSRAGERTDWVRVHAEHGAEVLVRHGISVESVVRAERGAVRCPSVRIGETEVSLRAGQSAVITRVGGDNAPVPQEVAPLGSAPLRATWGNGTRLGIPVRGVRCTDRRGGHHST
ncbi:hypothetical protein [Actinokineospora sp. NBRC 105648]|uniref:hypothetical protein n=1 Tax=Actinokineospora sp. NBRC 105648 TaxID=3032206 RepID=UPI00249FAA98|nr:hypothetical protein [Actinokineospora sp. NBRC 105648]GLZ36641.1 hypothetical protein Acsp05_02660 [Actinokineospora sp. NBRC 105648]